MTTVKEMRNRSWVNIVVYSDNEVELKKELDRYKSMYPKEGYMTHFDAVEFDPKTGYCVTGNRLSSCD